MKINEVKVSSTKSLTETIDKNNDTNFQTEDLVRVVQQEQSCNWSKPMSYEELLAEMDAWDQE
jgi:hypothetical protein